MTDLTSAEERESEDEGNKPPKHAALTPAQERAYWETQAGWWQDEFTDGADPEYVEQILPIVAETLGGATRILDIGTGEGQLARHLMDAGVNAAIGIDPSEAQTQVARTRAGGPQYARAAADALPFPDASFDAVVACLVFEHITAADEAIAEVARVLEPGGTFLFLLNHPLLQVPGSGWIDDHILEEQYWRIGPYLIEDVSIEQIAPDVHLPFVHRPMSRYVNAMADHGLMLQRMLEPAPPPGFLAKAPEYLESASIPRLLVLNAQRR